MLQEIGKQAKLASYQLAQASTNDKNQALKCIADLLELKSETLLDANAKDMQAARLQGLNDAILDRLLLTPERLISIANDVRSVMLLKDPVGDIIDGVKLENGLKLQRNRVPLGVIGVIYEARPNVTIDIAALCLKTGNASILRGGKETVNTNQMMIDVIQEALLQSNLPEKAVQSITNPDRKYITELLKLDKYVDMIIPRGGEALHQLCKEQSTIPVITGGIGVCHIFVDESMDLDKALPIVVNAKTQRPSTCNTLETLLVHEKIADRFLKKLSQSMAENQVTLHADAAALDKLQAVNLSGKAGRGEEINVMALQEPSLRQEWLSKDLNVLIVDSMESAINHIRQYGTGHSEAILTRSLENAEKFTRQVDAAAVYVNASTRFTDGAQFGLGAEVAVSTQKLHARGPMGLEALTTYKWIGYGDDLIRQ